MTKDPLDETVHVRLERNSVAALLASAGENERSLSAEIRLAIRRHLAARVAGATGGTETTP